MSTAWESARMDQQSLYWMYVEVVRKWLLGDLLTFGILSSTKKVYHISLSAQHSCCGVEFRFKESVKDPVLKALSGKIGQLENLSQNQPQNILGLQAQPQNVLGICHDSGNMDFHLFISNCCWQRCFWRNAALCCALYCKYSALLAAFFPTRPCCPGWQCWKWVHILRPTSDSAVQNNPKLSQIIKNTSIATVVGSLIFLRLPSDFIWAVNCTNVPN